MVLMVVLLLVDGCDLGLMLVYRTVLLALLVLRMVFSFAGACVCGPPGASVLYVVAVCRLLAHQGRTTMHACRPGCLLLIRCLLALVLI